MGWVKIDDGFFRHPKAIRAGREGRILFLASICYAGSGLTDGFVPAGALPVLAAETGIGKPKAAAELLVDAGLWEVTDGGYFVHDYLDYNTSSGRVQADRSSARERMHRNRSGNVRPNIDRSSPEVRQPEENTEENTETEENVNPPSSPQGGKAAAKQNRIPDDFQLDISLIEWAAGKGFTEPEIAHHAEAFVRYWRSEGGPRSRKYDWRQAFQSWLLKETPGKWPGSNVVSLANGRSSPPIGKAQTAVERALAISRGEA